MLKVGQQYKIYDNGCLFNITKVDGNKVFYEYKHTYHSYSECALMPEIIEFFENKMMFELIKDVDEKIEFAVPVSRLSKIE